MTRISEPTEAEFMVQVLELSSILGWEAAHFRPALTSRGWRTPVQGSLGRGFPDLVLARARDGRHLLAELKRDKAKTSPDQDRVIEVLRTAGALVYVWRPSDWDEIVATLT